MAFKIIKNSQFTIQCDTADLVSAESIKSAGLQAKSNLVVRNGVLESGVPLWPCGATYLAGTPENLKKAAKYFLKVAKAIETGGDLDDCEC